MAKKTKRCQFTRCRKWFAIEYKGQKYCNRNHRNAAGQERLRKRAKQMMRIMNGKH